MENEPISELDDRFRLLMQATSDVIWDLNFSTDRIWWNENIKILFGYTEETLSFDKQWFIDHIHPDDRDRVTSGLQNIQKGQRRAWSEEYRFRLANNSYVDVLDRWYIVLDGSGKATRLIGAMMDVSARKAHDSGLALQRSAAMIIANSPNTETAAPQILETLAQNGDWEFGAFWTVDTEKQLLHLSGYWHKDSVTGFQSPISSLTLPMTGIEVPSRVWSTNKWVWIPNISQAGLHHPLNPSGLGMERSFGFPVRSENKIIGAVEFYGRGKRRPSSDMIHIMEIVCDLFGQFIERKHMETQAFQLAAIVESSQDAIIGKNLERQITTWNKGAETIFGYTAKEIVGQSVDILFPKEDQKELAAIFEKVKRAEKIDHLERNWLTKDQRLVPLSLSISPIISSGQVVGISTIGRDISAAKELEQKLRVAKESAESATKAKSLFLANMSHELRTPMNAILGYSEILQDDARDRKQEEYIPDLQKINTAGKHLLALIDSILDISKIEAGKMQIYLEPFEISTLLHEVTVTIEPLAKKNSNQFTVNCPPDIGQMNSDLTRIRQSILNLLSNACKFTKNGQIRLEAKRERIAGRDWINFYVSDTGIGLSKQQIGKLFQDFSQADDSTTRRYGGTGLGLALSKRFCQMLKGDITVTSEPGKGSVFKIHLPADGSIPIASPAVPTSNVATTIDRTTTQNNGPTILVIDDDATTHNLMSHYLGKEGFNVVSALSGHEGLERAREISPDFITLDVSMPNFDGWAVLKELQHDPALSNIPVIMVSMMMDEKATGLALGVKDFFSKPVDYEKLAAILKKNSISRTSSPILIVDDDESSLDLMTSMLQKVGLDFYFYL